ncbi:hypothetical protein WR25_16102 [Diploscapter pachys]|uniref:Uncharacterized protein n=1 Tax=Diploscapter pachys TaxID=2018661 RepID=A0A2A2K725_9BILA|nr:hypothetical protein WR25_16102 [Diploscapter pachys]
MIRGRRMAQHLRDRAQRQVADDMRMAIVDLLEMVDIDDRQRPVAPVLRANRRDVRQHIVEATAIGDPGQRVLVRQLLQRVGLPPQAVEQLLTLLRHLFQHMALLSQLGGACIDQPCELPFAPRQRQRPPAVQAPQRQDDQRGAGQLKRRALPEERFQPHRDRLVRPPVATRLRRLDAEGIGAGRQGGEFRRPLRLAIHPAGIEAVHLRAIANALRQQIAEARVSDRQAMRSGRQHVRPVRPRRHRLAIGLDAFDRDCGGRHETEVGQPARIDERHALCRRDPDRSVAPQQRRRPRRAVALRTGQTVERGEQIGRDTGRPAVRSQTQRLEADVNDALVAADPGGSAAPDRHLEQPIDGHAAFDADMVQLAVATMAEQAAIGADPGVARFRIMEEAEDAVGLARAHDVDPMHAAMVPQPRAAHRADPQPLGRFRQRIDDFGRQIVRARQADVAGRIDQRDAALRPRPDAPAPRLREGADVIGRQTLRLGDASDDPPAARLQHTIAERTDRQQVVRPGGQAHDRYAIGGRA